MKYVVRVLTHDGEVHRTLQDAQRHADKCYGDALLALANKLVQKTDGKYGLTADFIDDNLNAFANLVPLRDDCLPPAPLKSEEYDE
jgi:hypothetical protein